MARLLSVNVGVRWSFRTGVCHNCENGLVSGAVAYAPQPLEDPATEICWFAAHNLLVTSS